VHEIFIAAQSPGVAGSLFTKPTSVGTSSNVKVVDVIDVEAVGLANDKMNKKSLVPFAPLKQSATTKPTVVVPQDVKEMLPGSPLMSP